MIHFSLDLEALDHDRKRRVEPQVDVAALEARARSLAGLFAVDPDAHVRSIMTHFDFVRRREEVRMAVDPARLLVHAVRHVPDQEIPEADGLDRVLLAVVAETDHPEGSGPGFLARVEDLELVAHGHRSRESERQPIAGRSDAFESAVLDAPIGLVFLLDLDLDALAPPLHVTGVLLEVLRLPRVLEVVGEEHATAFLGRALSVEERSGLDIGERGVRGRAREPAELHDLEMDRGHVAIVLEHALDRPAQDLPCLAVVRRGRLRERVQRRRGLSRAEARRNPRTRVLAQRLRLVGGILEELLPPTVLGQHVGVEPRPRLGVSLLLPFRRLLGDLHRIERRERELLDALAILGQLDEAALHLRDRCDELLPQDLGRPLRARLSEVLQESVAELHELSDASDVARDARLVARADRALRDRLQRRDRAFEIARPCLQESETVTTLDVGGLDREPGRRIRLRRRGHGGRGRGLRVPLGVGEERSDRRSIDARLGQLAAHLLGDPGEEGAVDRGEILAFEGELEHAHAGFSRKRPTQVLEQRLAQHAVHSAGEEVRPQRRLAVERIEHIPLRGRRDLGRCGESERTLVDVLRAAERDEILDRMEEDGSDLLVLSQLEDRLEHRRSESSRVQAVGSGSFVVGEVAREAFLDPQRSRSALGRGRVSVEHAADERVHHRVALVDRRQAQLERVDVPDGEPELQVVAGEADVRAEVPMDAQEVSIVAFAREDRDRPDRARRRSLESKGLRVLLLEEALNFLEPRTVVARDVLRVVGEILRRALDEEHDAGDGSVFGPGDLREISAPRESMAQEPESLLGRIGAQRRELGFRGVAVDPPTLLRIGERGGGDLLAQELRVGVEGIEVTERRGEAGVVALEIAARIESGMVLRSRDRGRRGEEEDQGGETSAPIAERSLPRRVHYFSSASSESQGSNSTSSSRLEAKIKRTSMRGWRPRTIFRARLKSSTCRRRSAEIS